MNDIPTPGFAIGDLVTVTTRLGQWRVIGGEYKLPQAYAHHFAVTVEPVPIQPTGWHYKLVLQNPLRPSQLDQCEEPESRLVKVG